MVYSVVVIKLFWQSICHSVILFKPNGLLGRLYQLIYHSLLDKFSTDGYSNGVTMLTVSKSGHGPGVALCINMGR
jgi:hypothetical protein